MRHKVKHSSTKKYAQLFLENGVDGLVFGFLNPDKTIDQERTKEFIELIHYYGASATLHKVIDITVDKHEALQTLHRLGIDRILTSPANYIPLKSDFRDIEIVAGGGIGEQNICSLLSQEMKSLHFSAKEVVMDNFGSYHQLSVSKLQRIIEKIN